jgi:hypothetical protein
MNYDFIAIPDQDVPQAREPLFQHLIVTYASETNKTASIIDAPLRKYATQGRLVRLSTLMLLYFSMNRFPLNGKSWTISVGM